MPSSWFPTRSTTVQEIVLIRLSGEIGSQAPDIKFRQAGRKSGLSALNSRCFGGSASRAAAQWRRVRAAPSKNAIAKLVSGACRVTVRRRASGWPGRCAASIADRSRSTAIRRPSVTSSIVRETSAAVSMARSAMLGEGTVCGISLSKTRTPMRGAQGSHLWLSPRARVLNSGPGDLWLSATGAVCERRVAASSGKCGAMDFVPSICGPTACVGRRADPGILCY